MRRAIVVLSLLASGPVAAQPARPAPVACAPCARGDALIDRFKLGAVRPLAPELRAMTLGEPLIESQYRSIVALRSRTPDLIRLGALDDSDLELVAAALCNEGSRGDCTVATAHALVCLADRCEVEVAHSDVDSDIRDRSERCQPSEHKHPPIGVALDWGNGWDRSRYPNDGRSWSLGIEGRYRLDRRWGIVARADRTAGRDAATDMDGDGHDDVATGAIARLTALAGPSFVLDSIGYERTTRFVRLDLLAGYLATPSQPGEDGLATGIDLSFQISAIRLGARFVQGLGDASSASQLLAHIGISSGSVPPRAGEDDCKKPHERSTRLGLGFELPLGGYGLSSELGYLATGFGVEGLWHMSRKLDLATHVDLLVYPGYERDRVIHEAALGGIRIDHKKRRKHTGWYSTWMAGYTHGAGFTPTETGTGPVGDVSLAWGGGEDDSAGSIRIHGRFGLHDNTAYRAIYVSAGFELHFDPRKWRDRDPDDYAD